MGSEKHILNLYESNQFEEAIRAGLPLLKSHSNTSDIHYIIGMSHLALGEYSLAQQYLEKCVKENPDNSAYRKSLGDLFYMQRFFIQAIEHYSLACQANPEDDQAFFKLATCQSTYGQNLGAASPEAEALLQQAIANYLHITNMKDNAYAWNNIACIYLYKNQIDQAELATKKALAINKKMPEALINLGNILFKKNKISAAIKLTEQALLIQQKMPSALNNLSTLYGYTGDAYRATEASLQAVALQPEISTWHDTLLLNQLYSDAYTDEKRAEFYKSYREAIEGSLPSTTFKAHLNPPIPDRKLKVAYVSGDFRKHSASYFTENLFKHHDHEKFQIFFYYNGNQVDTITERYQSMYSDAWRNIHGLDAYTIAQLARDDQIDIMIDLAGHTKYNALSAFAQKPAPIQITWLGFPETTGLAHMDYQIVDQIVVPTNATTAKFGLEKLWRLATPFCTYTPYVANPDYWHLKNYEVSSLPAIKNGYITFGSASNIIRLTPSTVKMWSSVLHAVPNSVLLLDAASLDEEEIANAIISRFVNENIESNRIKLRQRDSKAQYLLYHDFDIALDPFPSNGGATTFDALWMGIPVISQKGNRFASRIGASVLTHLGQADWVAEDETEFIEIAKKLASNVAQLSAIRQSLRQKMQHSSLMNGALFTKEFELALQTMWCIWCESEESKPAKASLDFNEALQLCDVLLEQGALTEAAQGYKMLLQKQPDCGRALHGLGMIMLLEENPVAAKALLLRAAYSCQHENQPSDIQAQVFAVLGNACTRLELFDEAVEYLQYSVKLNETPVARSWLNNAIYMTHSEIHMMPGEN